MLKKGLIIGDAIQKLVLLSHNTVGIGKVTCTGRNLTGSHKSLCRILKEVFFLHCLVTKTPLLVSILAIKSYKIPQDNTRSHRILCTGCNQWHSLTCEITTLFQVELYIHSPPHWQSSPSLPHSGQKGMTTSFKVCMISLSIKIK